MRKYYIFMIKKEIYLTYQNNSHILYKILENLYHLKVADFSYGISIYNQLCQTLNCEVLNNYLIRKFHNYKNNLHIIDNNTIIGVRPFGIIILTKKNIPSIMNVLLYYNTYMFVCDFDNKDFFWLKGNHDL